MALDGDRPSKRRGFDPRVQRTVAMWLVGGGLFFAAIVLAAVYFTIRSSQGVSAGDVRPPLSAFMQRGADNDVLAGHALMSANALRNGTTDDIARMFSQREAFEGFAGLDITSIREVPSSQPGSPPTVEVQATARYDDDRIGSVRATLESEGERWRILDVTIGQPRQGANP